MKRCCVTVRVYNVSFNIGFFIDVRIVSTGVKLKSIVDKRMESIRQNYIANLVIGQPDLHFIIQIREVGQF